MRISIIGGEAVLAAIAARKVSALAAIKAAVSQSVDVAQRRAIENLRGKVLHVQTGRLWQSVAAGKWLSADGLRGGFGTNVEYARIHEFGGTTRPHDIPQRLKRTGKMRILHHPGATIPPRPYMRPALEDSAADIRRIFVSRLGEALAGKS